MAAGAAVVVGGLAVISGSVITGGVSASPGQAVTGLDATSATAMAQSLVGSGLTVSNASFTGSPQAAGLFEMADPSTVGFTGGVVLSSGRVADVVGPNDSERHSTNLGAAGDADLTALVAPHATYDAAVLEFDFVPTSTRLSFDYVFASEEYREYVDSPFNDVFAFFVNGQNCAVVGSPAEPVAVNNVNHDTNASHYRDNPPGDASPVDLQFDGLTTVLTCEAEVQIGETNHLKLAIADTSDRIWDAAVFLRTGSFVANVDPVVPNVTVPGTVSGPTPITLAATDPDGDPLTYEVVTPPANGDLSGTGAQLTYTPDAGFTGTDSFTYQASDGKGTSDAGTVTIEVVAGSGAGSSTTSTTTTSTTAEATTSTTGAGAPPTTVATIATTATVATPTVAGVVTPRRAAADPLPLTGARTGLLAAGGGALVLVGIALMGARRRPPGR